MSDDRREVSPTYQPRVPWGPPVGYERALRERAGNCGSTRPQRAPHGSGFLVTLVLGGALAVTVVGIYLLVR